jgi:hypothetical protein
MLVFHYKLDNQVCNHYFGNKCSNAYHDAIINHYIGDVKYPQKPIRVSYELAECHKTYLQAWGGSSLKSMGGSLYRSNYGTSLSGGAEGGETYLTNADISNLCCKKELVNL